MANRSLYTDVLIFIIVMLLVRVSWSFGFWGGHWIGVTIFIGTVVGVGIYIVNRFVRG